ncbi:PRC-barrel domain-containing protein [Microvirga sp. 2YAF29]|uniref:PRC-barrel domain-containing protein n=1 Tax=Microvirga sp. 2YAF29 TaxID=3233031 RepID=UPI003F9C4487
MLSKHIALALLGSTLAFTPALAQTQPSTTTANPTASSSTMSSGNWMTQEKAGQWRASKIEGLNVYNNNNEKIGDISELLVDQNGKIEAVVIGVGGFLGMGEHDVAVPFDQIKFVNEARANTTAANTTTGTAAPGGTMGTTTTSPAPNATGSVAQNNANTMNRAAPDHAMLNMTKDQLKAAPEFKYSR